MDRIIVMIVDDDLDDRIFFKDAIVIIGNDYECIEARDGIEAIEYLERAHILPSFIFLDLNMPIMNGKECLEKLKQDPKLKNIPVIIYSTSSFWKDIDTCTQLGAAYYLNKTCDLFKLPQDIITAMEMASNHSLTSK